MAKDAPHLVKSEIEEYLDLEKRRLALQRQATDLEKLAKPLKTKIRAFVDANGGSDRTCTRSGFVLSLRERAGTPAWKEQFLLVAGQEAAEQVIADTPPTYSLVVEST